MRAQPYLLMEPLTEICISAAGDPFCVQCIMQSIEDMYTHIHTHECTHNIHGIQTFGQAYCRCIIDRDDLSISKMQYNIGIKYYMRVWTYNTREKSNTLHWSTTTIHLFTCLACLITVSPCPIKFFFIDLFWGPLRSSNTVKQSPRMWKTFLLGLVRE